MKSRDVRNIYKAAIAFLFLAGNILGIRTEAQAQEPRLVLPEGHTHAVKFAQFSPDSKRIVSASKDRTARIWEVSTGKLLHVLEGHTSEVNCAQFSPDGRRIVTASGNIAHIWDASTGMLLQTLKGHIGRVNSAQFSYDGKRIVTASDDQTARTWDSHKGKLLQTLKGHRDWVNKTEFAPDGKRIVTASEDHTVRIWDAATGQQIYSRVQLADNNYLITLPNSKYYMCSKDASKMVHYVTQDLKVIGFEQLDPVYNRPDKVLEHISQYLDGVDPSRIHTYRRAWERRADMLGLNREMLQEGSLAVPDTEIANTNEIDYFNTSGTVNIQLSAQDKEYKLLRLNVLVNEVPLYGSTGISLSNRSIRNFDTTLQVPLCIGNNKIQVSVMNELGLENFQYPTYVNYTPTEEIPAKTLFIGIAVDSFQQENYNLSYCVKDINDLSQVFKQQPNTEIITLTNSQVTKENVLALKERLAKTSIHDRVIISCSSHGDLDKNNNFYLATHDMDFNAPELRGIAYSKLEGLLDSIPARKKLLLLDACNSGLNDTKIPTQRTPTASHNNSHQDEDNAEAPNDESPFMAKVGRGMTMLGGSSRQQNTDFQAMMELFVNVQNETGTIVVSAAGGAEAAFEGVELEGQRLENGVFTHTLLEYIAKQQNETIWVNALKKFVEDRVEELTNGLQRPTSRQETMEVDWELWE